MYSKREEEDSNPIALLNIFAKRFVRIGFVKDALSSDSVMEVAVSITTII